MKFIITILLSFCLNASYSQVYRFRAAQSTISGKNDKLNWKEDNSLIVENYDDRTIKIYGNKESTLAWVELKEGEIGVSEKYVTGRFSYTTIDSEGNKCKVQVDVFNADKVGYDIILYVWYDKKVLAYTAKLIK